MSPFSSSFPRGQIGTPSKRISPASHPIWTVSRRVESSVQKETTKDSNSLQGNTKHLKAGNNIHLRLAKTSFQGLTPSSVSDVLCLWCLILHIVIYCAIVQHLYIYLYVELQCCQASSSWYSRFTKPITLWVPQGRLVFLDWTISCPSLETNEQRKGTWWKVYGLILIERHCALSVSGWTHQRNDLTRRDIQA